MSRYAAPQEPADHTAPAEPGGTEHLAPLPSAGPHRRAGRTAARRHRKPRRPRWLVAGLALASVVTATVITLTVEPAAPTAPPPDGRATPRLQH
ncbi:hypothetical protein [Streptomyces sp. NPDC054838]